jgi:serine/threonine protein kinase
VHTASDAATSVALVALSALTKMLEGGGNFISFILPYLRYEGGCAMIAEMEEEGVMQEYKFGETLGRGRFGMVLLATHNHSGEERVVKIIYKKNFLAKGGQATAMFDEAQMLRQFSHPHVIRMKEAIDIPQAVVTVFEYAPLGDLASYIQARKRIAKERCAAAAASSSSSIEMTLATAASAGGAGASPSAFHEEEAQALFWQILHALEYLHCMGCVHGNLTPENIVLSHNSGGSASSSHASSLPVLKLTGFTTSHLILNGPMAPHDLPLHCPRTSLYIAPEVLVLEAGGAATGAAAAAAAGAGAAAQQQQQQQQSS